MTSRIISASRREDMPAFRMAEIVRRFHNPTYADAFWMLWTKDPRHIPDAGLDTARIALQLTITGLGGTPLEPGVPPWGQVITSLEACLAAGISPDLVNWRLDPLIPRVTSHETARELAAILGSLGITRCTTSFITWYGQVKERWPEGAAFVASRQEETELATRIRDALGEHGITLYGCAQPHLAGIVIPSHCIDGDYLSRVTGRDFSADKDPHQRASCGCTRSIDIGEYRPCPHACRYCYSRKSDAPSAPDPQLTLF